MTSLQVIFDQKKLNNRAERIEVPKAFRDKFPDLTLAKSQKLFQQYIDAIASRLVSRLPFLGAEDTTYISTHGLVNECKDFHYKKSRYYVWNEFKDIYPFFNVISKGSNLTQTDNAFEKNTKVQIINKRLISMLLHERAPKTVYDELYKGVDLTGDDVEAIEIDMENLQNFIDNTEYALQSATDTALRAKLEKSLYQGQLVYKVGAYTESKVGTAILPMVQSPSPFGRIYYKGLNIQNVTKEVRSAIIGPHFQYDMNAAVYGIKLALFNRINGGENELVGTPKGTYTREYLNDKEAIRQRLARETLVPMNAPHATKVKAVKLALTAIGFGARTTSGFWFDEGDLKGPALTEIIKNKEARERFLADPWVENFLSEQAAIEEEILASLRADEDFETIRDTVAAANKKNGKATRPLLLAYVYQQWETKLMDIAVDILSQHGIEIRARIHDAFVVLAKVPARVLDEIYMAWGRYSSHIAMDCEEVRGWVPVEVKKAREAHDAGVEAHRAAIEREERNARIQKLRGAL